MTQPLEQIRSDAEGESYPTHLLHTGADALILFAAGFRGRQDGYWIAHAGMTATCVDIRPQLLDEMAEVYPDGWEFVTADAYDYADELILRGRRFDVVSVDPPTGQFGRCADNLYLLCALARHAVVLGTGPNTVLPIPDSWQMTDLRFRSNYRGGVYWAVLERK
jgi:hypothetical protein